jgi:dimethylaniline monooxygenase (N-oxide forming)
LAEEYPSHLSSAQFQEYIESYATHFDLLKDIVFNASVTLATRNESDTRWRLEMLVDGKPHSEEFDKVVFCHGYQTKPVMPKYEGQELFQGKLMHAQQYRTYVYVLHSLNTC